MALTAELRAKVAIRHTGAADFGGQVYTPTIEKLVSLTSGTGANQADLAFVDRRTLAASATEDLDLAGSLTDAFGSTITMAEVVAVYVAADAANVNAVVLGDAAAPVPWMGGTNPTISVKPGGVLLHVAPNASGLFTVGAGTADDLKVANGGGSSSVIFDIVIIGRSA